MVDAVAGELAARPRTLSSSRAAASATRGSGAALAAFAEQGGLPAAGRADLGRAPRARPRSRTTTRCCATPRGAGGVAPELVLRVGDLPTSKPLRQWLAGLGEEALQLVFDPESAWQDPAGAAATLLPADPGALLAQLHARLPRTPRAKGWLEQWTRDDRAARGAIAVRARRAAG